MFGRTEMRGMYLSQLRMLRAMDLPREEILPGVPFETWYSRARSKVSRDPSAAPDKLERIWSESFRETRHRLSVLFPRNRELNIETTDELIEMRIARLEGRPLIPIIFRHYEEGSNARDLRIAGGEEAQERIATIEARLRSNCRKPGQVVRDGDQLKVTLSQRRGTEIPAVDLALLVVLHHMTAAGWAISAPIPKFFATHVLPTITPEHTASPAAWAAHCTAVTLGYSICEKEGLDMPPSAIESAYKKVAALATNLHPENHRNERTVTLSPHVEALIAAAQVSPSAPHYPEVVAFLATNASFLKPKDLAHRSVAVFMRQFETFLERGLNIDRVFALAAELALHDVPKRLAIIGALKIISGVFSSPTAPWWFKENQSFSPAKWPEELSPKAFLVRQIELSRIAGRVYPEALDLYLPYAVHQKLDAANVSQERRMRMATQVAREYGIGNPKRGALVLEFAMDALARAPEAEQSAVYRRQSELLTRRRPSSEVIGILEGSDVVFEIPGVAGTLCVFGHEERLKLEQRFEGNLRTSDIDQMHEGFKLPLELRGSMQPALAIEDEGRRPLISSSLFNSTRLLGAPVATLDRVRSEDAVGAWLRLEERIAQEVRPDRQIMAAKIYLNFLAPKMPDPYSPPRELLRIISEYDDIIPPGYDFPACASIEERDGVIEENQRVYARRYELLADLADSQLLGILTEREFITVCNWMVAGIDPEQKRKIELDAMASAALEEKEHWASFVERFDDKLFKLHQRLEALEGRRKAHKFLKEPTVDLEFRIRRLKDEIKQVKKGIDPDDDYHGCRMPHLPMSKSRLLDEEITRTAQSRCSHLEREQRNSRVTYLMNGIALVKGINQLLTRRQISVGDAKDFLHCYLEVALTPGVEGSRASEVAVLAFQELPNALADLYATGLAEVLTRAGHRTESGIFPFPAQMIRDFGATRIRVAKLSTQIAQEGETSPPSAERISQGVEIVRQELIKCFPQVPLTDVELDRVVQTLFPPARYRDIAAALEGTDLARGSEDTMVTESALSSVLEASRFTRLAATVGTALAQNPVVPPVFLPKETWPDAITALDVGTGGERVLNAPPGIPLQDREAPGISLLSGEQIWSVVRKWREDDFGLRWAGGKVHVLHPIDARRVDFMQKWLGFKSTSFKLIHADTSLLLPPMPSSEELKLLVRFLLQEGVVQAGQPEIQVTVTGRLNRQHCAHLAVLKLLTTEVGLKLDPNSFKTTHDELTGLRLVVFDAEHPVHRTPFGALTPGRTDLLGCVDPDDIDLCRLAVTVLGDYEEGRPFGAFASDLKKGVSEVLDGYGLRHVLDDCWTHQHARDDLEMDGVRHFHDSVSPVVNAWFDCKERLERTGERSGIIFDMRNVVTQTREKARVLQNHMLHAPEYAEERRIWFSFTKE